MPNTNTQPNISVRKYAENDLDDLTWATGGGRLSESEIKFGGRQTSERDRGRPGSRRQLDGAAIRRGGGGDAPASKKKFVLVTTKPDGSKKQTVLEPDDPRSGCDFNIRDPSFLLVR